MALYKNQQRYIQYRGREFHFVSYEGLPADPRKERAQVPPTWFLLNAGKRWAAFPQMAEEPEEDIDRRLVAWLEQNVFDGIPD